MVEVVRALVNEPVRIDFLFLIIPDWIYLYWVVMRKSTSHIVEDACQFSWAFGDLTDFFIYLLGPPKVRKAAKKMFFNQQ